MAEAGSSTRPKQTPTSSFSHPGGPDLARSGSPRGDLLSPGAAEVCLFLPPQLFPLDFPSD